MPFFSRRSTSSSASAGGAGALPSFPVVGEREPVFTDVQRSYHVRQGVSVVIMHSVGSVVTPPGSPEPSAAASGFGQALSGRLPVKPNPIEHPGGYLNSPNPATTTAVNLNAVSAISEMVGRAQPLTEDKLNNPLFFSENPNHNPNHMSWRQLEKAAPNASIMMPGKVFVGIPKGEDGFLNYIDGLTATGFHVTKYVLDDQPVHGRAASAGIS